MPEDTNKDTNIKFRIDTMTKEKFYTLCSKDAINPSAKIRQLIEQWIKEQEDKNIIKSRKTDTKKC